MKRNAEFLRGISTEVLLDEGGSKEVKTGGHRRMRGEEIAGSSRGQGHFEGLAHLLHEATGAFQDGEGCVPFIQMTDLRLHPERAEQPPSADSKEHFLLEAQLRSAPIQLAGDPPIHREVRGV